MNEVEEIISKLYDAYGVSNDNQLSKELGLKSNSSISNWRKSGIVPEKYKNKCSYFMSKNEHPESTSDLVTINLYEDIQASAGYGANNDDIVPVKLQFDKNFLRQFFNITKFDNLDIIRVIGDSMLPAIKDGEYIIVERGFTARNGDTVIANIDGELYVKRLYKIPLEQWVRLESENDSYPPIELNTPEKLQAFRIVGVVKSKIKLY
ncbi:MAG: helix-turn-helix transcriptional regulator [Candidatus Paceibacteria bacterium]